MIVKEIQLDKIDLNNYFFFLIYGNNQGAKKKLTQQIISKKENSEIQKFYEKQILDNQEKFINEILSGSLFAKEKIIIINRASDKILKILQESLIKRIKDLVIIINAESLDKKSKLRAYFEKKKEFICTPVYPDTDQYLSILASNFFKEKKISLSQSNINFIISKCNGDREFLESELNKIELYFYKKKKIGNYELAKLVNLLDNHSILELVDNCLIKNVKKVALILNENNFNNEECVMIIRAFLTKTKKLLDLANNFDKNNNLEVTILEAKPPIFWKEKETVKLQIQKWKPKMIKELISNINHVELELKKNSQSSLNILMNFIFEQISSKA